MAPISEFLHSLGFGFGLICTTGYSGVLLRVGSSFSEDGPPVVQFSRNSRQLREVSACVASEDVSSSESYWTLSVSGLLQPRNVSTSLSQLAPCFYHEWINLRFLARVDENAGLPAESGGTRAAVFEPDGSWSSALGGAPFHLAYASVHHGAQHHVGEVFLSSQSNSGFRVNPDSVGVSEASEKVAGVN